MKNALVAFFNVARFGAKLLTASKKTTYVVILASPPCDFAAWLRKSTGCYGNDVLLRFEVDDYDDAVNRAAELNAEIVMPKHRNPPDGSGGPNHWEIWLRDPDGYTVVIASPDGSAG